jgi:hypothetical protein
MCMIRHRQGEDFLLIRQHDHALLSGKFAACWGGGEFVRTSPWEQVVDGVAMHDCGWPVHDDDGPTLNGRGEPLHVFESPVGVSVRVWTESAVRAAGRDAYVGLLVSVHVLSLSGMLMARLADSGAGAGGIQADRVAMFELLKFQHRESERQEQFRGQLGMRNDVPLRNGLAEPGVGPAEDVLRFHYGLLRAMDRLSLDVCCTRPVSGEIDGVYPRPGGQPVTLNVRHLGQGAVAVSPWPFDGGPIESDLPCRRLPAKPFDSEDAFRAAYAAAPVETYQVRVSPLAGDAGA